MSKKKFGYTVMKPLRLAMTRCNICDGKRSIQTDYDGWIQCPACRGEGTVTVAQYLANRKVLAERNRRVSDE